MQNTMEMRFDGEQIEMQIRANIRMAWDLFMEGRNFEADKHLIMAEQLAKAKHRHHQQAAEHFRQKERTA